MPKGTVDLMFFLDIVSVRTWRTTAFEMRRGQQAPVARLYQLPKMKRWMSWFIMTRKKSVNKATPANDR